MDFRLKGPKGQATLRGVPADRPLNEFLQDVSEASGVPVVCLSLRAGFPPQPLKLPEEASEATVSSLGLRSGESIIVQHVEPAGAQGLVLRRIIAADNSCLFNAFGYVTEKVRDKAPSLRAVVAQRIAGDPERFCEAFLAKPNAEYCKWIQQENSWGGAIELSILAEHFECEIAAYDICTKRRDLHGEGQGYAKRCMLIYDGIHYDALALAAEKSAAESDDITMFQAGAIAELVDSKARVLVEEQHQQRQFTDTGNFTLRCVACQKGLKGEKEAELHAKETGHQNFAEY
eukprot:symbB.v1.2.007773.t1/scaffold481.1/size198263/4